MSSRTLRNCSQRYLAASFNNVFFCPKINIVVVVVVVVLAVVVVVVEAKGP
jgi:hypothetical protein